MLDDDSDFAVAFAIGLLVAEDKGYLDGAKNMLQYLNDHGYEIVKRDQK